LDWSTSHGDMYNNGKILKIVLSYFAVQDPAKVRGKVVFIAMRFRGA
jgi:hypothetical protein